MQISLKNQILILPDIKFNFDNFTQFLVHFYVFTDFQATYYLYFLFNPTITHHTFLLKLTLKPKLTLLTLLKMLAKLTLNLVTNIEFVSDVNIAKTIVFYDNKKH